MSQNLLEVVRRAIVTNIDNELIAFGLSVRVGEKVRPDENKMQQKFDNNQLPMITFAGVTDIEQLATGVHNARIRLQVHHRAVTKDKTLWDIYDAMTRALSTRTINLGVQAQVSPIVLPPVPIWIQKFKIEGEADDLYNKAFDFYTLRSLWTVQYVNIP